MNWLKKRTSTDAAGGKHTFSQAVEEVNQQLEKLSKTNLHFNYIAGSTNGIIHSVNSSMGEISDSNNELTERIRSINEITDTMGNSIDETAYHINNLNDTTAHMLESNRETMDLFQQTLQNSREAGIAVDEIAENTLSTNQAAHNILKIIDIINDIALKTNLLSLNASIEAARAGAAGRGFAVVAREIKALAGQSKQSVEEISTILKKLEDRSNASVKDIEQVKTAFEKQTKNLDKTDALLNRTHALIEEVSEKAKGIETNAEKLNEAKTVIGQNMASLQELSESNYTATGLISSDFSKIVSSSANMAKMAFALTDIKDSLKTSVAALDETSANAAARVEEQTLRVGYMANYGSLCSVVSAIKLGSFAKENLKVELKRYANGASIVDALEAGEVDMGYIGHGSHKLCIKGRAVIMLLSHISNAESVIGSKKNGVRTIADLRGKRIGNVAGGTTEAILRCTLEDGNIPLSDVTLVNMKPEEVVAAMQRGEIDACALWSPYSLEVLKAMGNDALTLSNNLKYSNRIASLSSWVTAPSYAKEHADIVLRFTRALYKGMNYRAIEENIQRVAQWVSELTGIDSTSAYEQRNDADWSSDGFVAIGAENGTLANLYRVQQDGFLAAGDLQQSVPVENYVLLDNMIRAAQ